MTAYEIKQLKNIIRQCDKISNYLEQSKTTKETFLIKMKGVSE